MNICFSISEIDWGLTKDVFGVIGSVASLAGVAVATYVGFKGLSVWRRQLAGNTNHAMAIKVLVDIYRFREAIQSAREPMFTLEDFNFSGTTLPEDQSRRAYAIITGSLKSRYEAISQIKAQLEVAAFECEAAWGEVLKKPLSDLFKVYAELKKDVDSFIFLTSPDSSDEGRRAYVMFNGERTNVAFNDHGANSDKFSERFTSAVSAIESVLRDRITR